MGGVALGSLVAPLVVEAIGARGALVVVGVLLPALIAVSWRRLREIDRATAPAPELELVQAVELFAPLSVAAKEHVARALVPVDVRAGDAVVRVGEPGDRFYVLASGELEVEAGGRRSRLDRTGDYLGEIALLRSIPRTATVTALSDARLYALEREDFLAAVTGHSAVSAAADAVVERRLAGAAAE
jgi:signal-transduction protein with cAMP-binding, CBS, and nucleotidyltransferase domain